MKDRYFMEEILLLSPTVVVYAVKPALKGIWA
jgi:hypothetical protein